MYRSPRSESQHLDFTVKNIQLATQCRLSASISVNALQASAKTKARLKDLDEEYAMFRPPMATPSAPNMYRSLDPGLNLAADYYDSFSEGYGNLHDARKVCMLDPGLMPEEVSVQQPRAGAAPNSTLLGF